MNVAAGDRFEVPVTVNEPSVLYFVWNMEDMSYDIVFGILFGAAGESEIADVVEPQRMRESQGEV